MSSAVQKLLSKQPDPGLDSTTLFLSIYLIILAFFLLLNALSHPNDKKSKTVVSSVTKSFEAGDTKPSFIIQQEAEGIEGVYSLPRSEYFSVLKRFIDRDAHLLSSNINKQGNVMQASFPVKAFFAPKTIDILKERQLFMEELVGNIGTKHAGVRVDVEIVLTAKKTGDMVLEVKRAGAFAKTLESLGVSPRSIKIGVAAGKKKKVRFTFYARTDEHIKKPQE